MPPQRFADARPGSGTGVRFRAPEPADGQFLWALAGDVGLDLNSPYAYVLWGEHFGDTSLVAVEDDRIVGFVTGFLLPRSGDTVFVWQIGVAREARRRGLGGRLLDELLARTGCRHLEATVTPSNGASAALFRAVGDRHGAPVHESVAFEEHLFPDGHEAEIRFRIGPITDSND